VMNLLLDAGADVNQSDDNGNPLIVHTLEQPGAQALKIFIACGADVNLAGSSGYTPLCYACQPGNNSDDAIPLLLEAGADPDKANAAGRTPLMHTMNPYAARLLLSQG